MEGRTYLGVRDANGATHVFVEFTPGRERWSLPRSVLARTKSADSYEWGYAGSGPSILAHSMLVYEFQAQGKTAEEAERTASHQGLYQDFKADYLIALPRDGSGEQWRITSNQISDWLQARRWFDAMDAAKDPEE